MTGILRILVVEDEEVLRELVTAYLGKIFPEAQTETATNGVEGLRMFSQAQQEGRPYGLVITDINMPEMNGMQMLIRLVNANPKPIRIVMSTEVPESNEYFDFFLQKAFGRDEFKAVIAQTNLLAVPQ